MLTQAYLSLRGRSAQRILAVVMLNRDKGNIKNGSKNGQAFILVSSAQRTARLKLSELELELSAACEDTPNSSRSSPAKPGSEPK